MAEEFGPTNTLTSFLSAFVSIFLPKVLFAMVVNANQMIILSPLGTLAFLVLVRIEIISGRCNEYFPFKIKIYDFIVGCIICAHALPLDLCVLLNERKERQIFVSIFMIKSKSAFIQEHHCIIHSDKLICPGASIVTSAVKLYNPN